jgi:hypothetical protein
MILCGRAAQTTHIKSIAVFFHPMEQIEVASGKINMVTTEAEFTRLESELSFLQVRSTMTLQETIRQVKAEICEDRKQREAQISEQPLWGFSSSNPDRSQSRAEQQQCQFTLVFLSHQRQRSYNFQYFEQYVENFWKKNNLALHLVEMDTYPDLLKLFRSDRIRIHHYIVHKPIQSDNSKVLSFC